MALARPTVLFTTQKDGWMDGHVLLLQVQIGIQQLSLVMIILSIITVEK